MRIGRHTSREGRSRRRDAGRLGRRDFLRLAVS